MTIICPIYDAPQAISRISPQNLGMYLLLLMYASCWFQQILCENYLFDNLFVLEFDIRKMYVNQHYPYTCCDDEIGNNKTWHHLDLLSDKADKCDSNLLEKHVTCHMTVWHPVASRWQVPSGDVGMLWLEGLCRIVALVSPVWDLNVLFVIMMTCGVHKENWGRVCD